MEYDKKTLEQKLAEADMMKARARKEALVCYFSGTIGDLREYIEVYKVYCDYADSLRREAMKKLSN